MYDGVVKIDFLEGAKLIGYAGYVTVPIRARDPAEA